MLEVTFPLFQTPPQLFSLSCRYFYFPVSRGISAVIQFILARQRPDSTRFLIPPFKSLLFERKFHLNGFTSRYKYPSKSTQSFSGSFRIFRTAQVYLHDFFAIIFSYILNGNNQTVSLPLCLSIFECGITQSVPKGKRGCWLKNR